MKKLMILALLPLIALAAATPSPNDSTVVAPSTATLIDANGIAWGINQAACPAPFAAGSKAQVVKGGVADIQTCSVIELAIVNGVVWQKNLAGMWYPYTGTGTNPWGANQTTSPLPTLLGTATLTWVAPTTYTNGAPITGALTYNVYRGATAAALTKLTSVTGLTYIDQAGSATPTTYFYAVTAVQPGVESAETPTVSDTIQAPSLIPSPPTAVAVK